MTRAALAVLALLLLAGCGGKDARRSSVNKYIASVNEIEQDAFVQLNHARTAYLALARGKANERQLQRLAEAPATIRHLRTRIAELTPPRDATRMHASLLRLLELDASFATEVSTFARYVRAVGPLETQVGSLTTQLRDALRREHTSAPEQKALTRYAAGIRSLLTRFRRLHAPAALAPWHREQVARLEALGDGARDVANGLAHGDRARAARGLSTLSGAAAASPVTAADRSAILAYNARLKRIRAAADSLAREQRRLAKELT